MVGVGYEVGANSGSSDTLDVLPADGCLIDNHIVWLHGGVGYEVGANSGS